VKTGKQIEQRKNTNFKPTLLRASRKTERKTGSAEAPRRTQAEANGDEKSVTAHATRDSAVEKECAAPLDAQDGDRQQKARAGGRRPIRQEQKPKAKVQIFDDNQSRADEQKMINLSDLQSEKP
jgi:hypothetical protein